ncbi:MULTISPECIES: hypothetical protein [Komagataeibacter]|uniref:Uncharacterized protein n=1 Tax=Komagataeibacter oboediens TaxID=65958 RepID=A0ABS5SS36_9PROT|nr:MULTISPECIES: hypothetical protein [Komagataeibacter]MBE7731327.1 hypothetical protein [Komagataeibacter sp. FXV3]MBT0677097.1 hypothetical protein [Komagataeibacter oboediens]MBT0680425.1 hypothetical protein [Komagataeibacter oboediens]GCE80459.1 hypothetical protein MSKU3_1934 [Komagataeibacter oboediens]GCE88987.1 hypothetical protein MSKU15_0588 [Komagataeibacter diospyri]
MFGGNGMSGPAGFILGRMSCQYNESLQRNIRQALHGAAPPHFNELEEQVRLISRLTEALNLANAHSDKLESQLEDWKDYAHGLESQIRELKDHLCRTSAHAEQVANDLKISRGQEKDRARDLEATCINYRRLSDDHAALTTKAANMERRIRGYLSMEDEWRKRQS